MVSSSGATKSLRDALTASSAFPIEAADEIAERLGLDFTKVKAEAEAKAKEEAESAEKPAEAPAPTHTDAKKEDNGE